MNRLFSFLILFATATYTYAQKVATNDKITNDCFWYATDSVPIYSQGGGIFKFPDPKTGTTRYYWYGVRYKGAEKYLKDPSVTITTHGFHSVTCYSSEDLVNWRFEGDVLTPEELERGGGDSTGWVGRLGVAYMKTIGKYALCVQHTVRDKNETRSVLIATSDTPTGKFSWHNWFTMKDMIGTPNTGDQTVFTDEDTGKSYLVYSYGSGRNKIYLSEIGVRDGKVCLLDCHQVFRGAGREGNCMFKYKGKYYMCASDLYGWDSSHAYYLTADSIYGPYTPENNMEVMDGCSADYAHVTQTGFFVTIRGTKEETVVYCGDRWADFAGNGLGYNQWAPLSFTDSRPYFNSLSSWHLNAVTGEWKVAKDNNYVRNGSFEADRRSVPNPVKPRQDWLSGWKTKVIKGNVVSVDSEDSPRLNYFNTQADRQEVVGEKSLNISDKVPFERIVTQEIVSTPHVALPDGKYLMRAKACVSGKFSRLEMFAQSNGKRKICKIRCGKNDKWTRIAISGISITGGKAVIGFHAKGTETAYCHIDDVEFVQE